MIDGQEPMQVLVYGDSISWGIVPLTRRRFPWRHRWPGVLETGLQARGLAVRVIEDTLNGRRTVWDDPYRPGRNGRAGLAQRIESCSPLALVILMLGANDFQSMHPHRPEDSAMGIGALVTEIRRAPVEPGMPIPPILVVAPPPMGVPAGPVARKFHGAPEKSAGLASALAEIAEEMDCPFFDSGGVIGSSPQDGVHIDAEQHQTLGSSLVEVVASLLA